MGNKKVGRILISDFGALASGQFRALQKKFAAWDIPLPGGDKELVYARMALS